jgi:hypothetical protein
VVVSLIRDGSGEQSIQPMCASKWTSTLDTPTCCLKFLFRKRFIDTAHPVRQTGKRGYRSKPSARIRSKASKSASFLKISLFAFPPVQSAVKAVGFVGSFWFRHSRGLTKTYSAINDS